MNDRKPLTHDELVEILRRADAGHFGINGGLIARLALTALELQGDVSHG